MRASKNLQNIATLGVASGLSLCIPVLITPILSRLYTPADYGVWGVFSSYAGIFAVGISGRFDVAIVKAKNAFERDALAGLSIWLLLLVSCFVLLLVTLDDLLDTGVISTMGWLAYLLPLYLIFQGGVQVVQGVANWCERYRVIGGINVWTAVIQGGIRLGLGAIRLGAGGLLLGPVASAICVGIGGARMLRMRIGSLLRIPWRVTRLVARRNYRFPLFEMPSSVLNVAATGLPIILFSLYYGEELTGFLTMGISLLFVPISFAGSAIGKVYYKNACVMCESDLRRFTMRLMSFLTLLGLVSNGVVLGLGRILLPVILGDKWLEAGVYVEILSFWTYVVLVVSPVSTLLIAKDRQGVGLLFNVLLVLGRLISVFLCGWLGARAEIAIMFYALVSGIVWIAEGGYLLRLLRVSDRRVLGIVLGGGVFVLSWLARIYY